MDRVVPFPDDPGVGAGRVGIDLEMSSPAGFLREIPEALPMLAAGVEEVEEEEGGGGGAGDEVLSDREEEDDVRSLERGGRGAG